MGQQQHLEVSISKVTRESGCKDRDINVKNNLFSTQWFLFYLHKFWNVEHSLSDHWVIWLFQNKMRWLLQYKTTWQLVGCSCWVMCLFCCKLFIVVNRGRNYFPVFISNVKWFILHLALKSSCKQKAKLGEWLLLGCCN